MKGRQKKKFIPRVTRTRTQWIGRPAHTRSSNWTTQNVKYFVSHFIFGNGMCPEFQTAIS